MSAPLRPRANSRTIKVASYTVVGNAFEAGKVTNWSPAVISGPRMRHRSPR